MNDYRQMPRDEKWLALIAAHNAAAALAEHDEECRCTADGGFSSREHTQYSTLYRAAFNAKLGIGVAMPPVRMVRDGDCVATWRTIN